MLHLLEFAQQLLRSFGLVCLRRGLLIRLNLLLRLLLLLLIRRKLCIRGSSRHRADGVSDLGFRSLLLRLSLLLWLIAFRLLLLRLFGRLDNRRRCGWCRRGSRGSSLAH